MGKLSEKSVKLIEMLLEDPAIKGNLIDDPNKEVYKTLTICEDGSIVLGKTRCLWWNRLIGDEKTLSFIDFAIKVITALSGQANNQNEIVLKGLTEDLIRKAVAADKYDYVVDRLFDVARYGTSGPIHSEAFQIQDKFKEHVDVTCKDGIRIVRLPGSGDKLCTIHVGVVGVDLDD